jgi:transposase InsO family protein
MPFREFTLMATREAFVREAVAEGANMRALCRAYGISPTTGYHWVARYRVLGEAGLDDRSRRPHTSPTRSSEAVEAAVVALRQAHPSWGGRKLHHRLRALGQPAPPASTCTEILRRHGLLDPERADRPRALQRFVADAPNALWQLDFKGGVTLDGRPAHPLHVLDDATRFLLAATLCPNQGFAAVQAVLAALFAEVGLPERILADNGVPWGSPPTPGSLTRLSAWWVRLGIRVSHGRPFHPQTQGKVERSMRTVKAELFAGGAFPDAVTLQDALDRWRTTDNTERPHEALDDRPPAAAYQPSPRRLPETLPPIVYRDDDTVRLVSAPGVVSLANRRIRISHALIGEPVAFRPTGEDGIMTVHYCDHYLRTVDLRGPVRTR